MNRALIDSRTGRVCQVVDAKSEFEVADPLYWVDCPDDAETELVYADEKFTKPPEIDSHSTAFDDAAEVVRKK